MFAQIFHGSDEHLRRARHGCTFECQIAPLIDA